MKTTQQHHHPLIWASTRQVEDDFSDGGCEVKESPKEPVIRLKLDKPLHWNWQLTTTADDLPVIQLLDKNGKLLVETNGRVAQRARGSFRDGLKSHESFPESCIVEEKETKPKEQQQQPQAPPPAFKRAANCNYDGFSSKYGSTSFPVGYRPRKSRSAVSICSSASSSPSYGPRKMRKRHSSSNASDAPTRSRAAHQQQLIKSDESDAKKYSASDYLRQQIVKDLSKDEEEDGTTGEESRNQLAKGRHKKMKAYLHSRSDTGVMRKKDTTSKTSVNTFKDCDVADEQKEPEEVPEDKNEKEIPMLQSKKLDKEELERIRQFLQEKIQAKMQEERNLQRTLSFPMQCNNQNVYQKRNGIISRMDEVKKTHLDCSSIRSDKQGNSVNYKTRKIRSDANIRFDPGIHKSEARQKISKKNSSGSMDRKKCYRKTRSDMLLNHNLPGSILDSEMDPADTNYPTRRIKSQDNFERSWREYKERKKQERMLKENDYNHALEEDFMKKPRWKDLRTESCDVKNCKVCENMIDEAEYVRNTDIKGNNKGSSATLQENYWMMDQSKPDEPKIEEHENENDNRRSPDCGYDSISKRSSGANKEPYDVRENLYVKKSNTFKIIDGGNKEDNDVDAEVERVCYDYRNKTNEDIAKDYFRRVYELLRRRQEEAKKVAEGRIDEKYEDTSSSNYLQEEEKVEAQIKRRRRRRKMDKAAEGNYSLRDFLRLASN